MPGPRRFHSGPEILDLIERVYECATSPECWPSLMGRLASATNSFGVALVAHDFRSNQGRTAWAHGADPTSLEEYPKWAPKNVFLHSTRSALYPGLVTVAEHMVPDREAMRSEFYEGFLRPHGILHHVGAILHHDGDSSAHLSAVRELGRPSHSDSEVVIFRTLMPHLQRAIAIHRRLAGAELVGTTLGDALERVAVAACLLDRRGRPVYVNRLARAVFDAGDGLSLNASGLAASRPRDDRALRAAVAAALGPIRPDETATGGLVSVFRPSGRREYALMIARVRLTPLDLDPGSPAVAVFVSDPEVRPETSDETLVRLYGLTSAEARIASLLVTGLTVEEIRERIGVTVNTLRTHLKRIYSKTGTRGQADLVRLLLPMAAVSAVA